ncbi:MAG: leucine-rich repeat domain-containing protein [Clostridia bacterium]|nr:leucine-rich repeat domain-containing protein [Clostridia bacterium]
MKRKSVFYILLACALLVTAVLFSSCRISLIKTDDDDIPEPDEGQFEFQENGDGTYTLIGVKESSDGRIFIPEKYNGGKVTRIHKSAFSGSDWVLTVYIPKNVTYVAAGAFEKCSALAEVVLDGDITVLEGRTFANCTSLKRVTLPNTLREIKGYAFSGCRSLEAIYLPEKLEDIEEKAFSGCKMLRDINGDPLNDYYSFVGNCVIRRDDLALVLGCAGSELGKVGGVEKIAAYAFYGVDIASLVIPDSVTEIDPMGIYSCDQLTSVHIGSGVKSDINNILRGCKNVSNVSVSADNEKYFAKTDIIYLKETGNIEYVPPRLNGDIIIPNGAVLSTLSSFSGRTDIVSVQFLDNVSDIPDEFFAGCTSLERVTMGNGVKRIGNNTFSGCSALREVQLSPDLTHIGSNAFYGCAIEKIVIPRQVNYIGMYAFAKCYKLISAEFIDPDGWGLYELNYHNSEGTLTNTLRLNINETNAQYLRERYVGRLWRRV